MSNCPILVALLSFKTQTLVALATAPSSALISCLLIQCAMLTSTEAAQRVTCLTNTTWKDPNAYLVDPVAHLRVTKQGADTVLGVWHRLSGMESTTGPSQLASLSP